MITKNQLVTLIDQLEEDNFFGTLTLHFDSGNIVRLEKNESIKDLSYLDTETQKPTTPTRWVINKPVVMNDGTSPSTGTETKIELGRKGV
jgi:hypothetical protein